ncbi:MAG: hypothetical protein E6G51_01865 [Actinobacteria bacterium]|nr:MAG: hypothetical protein E6G51_01865 [Actinomycetota bacterium]
MARWLLLFVLGLAALTPAGAGAAEIVNGGFESGNFSGWEVRQATGAGKWYAYKGTKPPIPHERGAVSVQPPPQGAYAAIADEVNPETLLLYQDLQLEPGTAYKLSLLAYYDSYSALTTPAPDTLSVDEEVLGSKPNQQFRIDVMKAGSPPDSVDPNDVLLQLFHTKNGGARSMAPTQLIGNLAPFAGQTVRLRIAVAATEEVLSAGVDAVALSAPDGTFPQAQLRRIRPRKAKANPRAGTVILPVQVPEAGRLIATSASGKARAVSAKPVSAGVVKLRLRPSAKGRAILDRRHKLRVGITLTWRPLTGGSQKLRLPVVFRLRKS